MFQQVNLYTPIARHEPKRFSARAIAAALGILALGLGALTALSWWHVATLHRALEAVEVQARARDELNAETERVINGGESPESAEARLKGLAAELERRQQALKYLRGGAAGSHRGFAGRMAALARQQLDGLWLRGVTFSSDSGQFQISGSALRPELVPIYLARLASEDALAGTRLDSLEIRQPRKPLRGEVDFSVASSASPPAHLADLAEPGVAAYAANSPTPVSRSGPP
jgi:hypothetical protein